MKLQLQEENQDFLANLSVVQLQSIRNTLLCNYKVFEKYINKKPLTLCIFVCIGCCIKFIGVTLYNKII